MRRFLLLFIPAAVVIALVLAGVHLHFAKMAEQRLRLDQEMVLARAEGRLQRDVDAIAADLRLLSSSTALALRVGDDPKALSDHFRRFIETKSGYDQVFYWNPGSSRLVVATNSPDQRALPDPASQGLRQIASGPPGRLAASYHAAEAQPPVLRFAVTLEAAQGPGGVLALDYPLAQLYSAITTRMSGVPGRRVLVGPDGAAVPAPEEEPLSLSADTLSRLQDAERGQFSNDDGLVSFITASPALAGNAPAVSIVSLVEQSTLQAALWNRMHMTLLLYALLLIAIALICALWAQRSNRRLRRLRHSLMLSRVVEQTNDLVCITDPQGRIIYINPSFERVSGFQLQELEGKPFTTLDPTANQRFLLGRLRQSLKQSRNYQTTLTNRARDGSLYYQQTTISPLYSASGELIGYVSTGKDISGQVATEAELQRARSHHPVTGLPNRALLLKRLQQAISQARAQHRVLAVLALDLARFERLNNSLGHERGNRLLQQVAKRMQRALNDQCTLAHPGADEFLVLVPGLTTADEARVYAERLQRAFDQPYEIDGRTLLLTAAMGIAVFPNDAEEAAQLLEHAAIALQYAKHQGGRHYTFFSTDMRQHARQRLQLEGELREAVENQEFELHYQPVVGSAGRVEGLEALLRWPGGNGMRMPDEFIPVLEDTKLIVPLTDWILKEATRAAASLGRSSGRPIQVAVNVSAQSFHQSDLQAAVRNALAVSGLDPNLLTLEITERLILESAPEVRGTLETLRRTGVKIAIDDFGVGYSSLAYLTRLPVDTLKIDRAFIHGMDSDSRDAALVSAILAMAGELEIDTVAEGVEHKEQMLFLRKHHCNRLQGFYFSKPLPMDAIRAHLQRSHQWPWPATHASNA